MTHVGKTLNSASLNVVLMDQTNDKLEDAERSASLSGPTLKIRVYYF